MSLVPARPVGGLLVVVLHEGRTALGLPDRDLVADAMLVVHDAHHCDRLTVVAGELDVGLAVELIADDRTLGLDHGSIELRAPLVTGRLLLLPSMRVRDHRGDDQEHECSHPGGALGNDLADSFHQFLPLSRFNCSVNK